MRRVPLTLTEARARAALISDVSYDLHLDLSAAATAAAYALRAVVRFSCAEPGASTFLELAHARDVTVDGAPAAYDGRRIALDGLAATNEVGLGVVPEHRSGRLFRDLLGTVNQRVAAACDEVHLVVAGRVLRL